MLFACLKSVGSELIDWISQKSGKVQKSLI